MMRFICITLDGSRVHAKLICAVLWVLLLELRQIFLIIIFLEILTTCINWKPRTAILKKCFHITTPSKKYDIQYFVVIFIAKFVTLPAREEETDKQIESCCYTCCLIFGAPNFGEFADS